MSQEETKPIANSQGKEPLEQPNSQEVVSKVEVAESQVQPSDSSMPPSDKVSGQGPVRSLIMKLASVMAGLGWVAKRGTNTHFNYKYATESDILDAIRQPLGDKSIFVQSILDSVETLDTGRTEGQYKNKMIRTIVRTRYIFHDGESGERLTINGYGVGEDTADKGVYKALTGAMKSAMSKNFLISSGDDPEKEDSDDDNTPDNKDLGKEIRRASQSKEAPKDDSYFIDDAIAEVSVKSGGSGKSAWVRCGIKTIKTGWVSTFDPKMAEAAEKMKGSGFIFRFNVKRENNYINLISLSELDPDGNIAKHYEAS